MLLVKIKCYLGGILILALLVPVALLAQEENVTLQLPTNTELFEFTKNLNETMGEGSPTADISSLGDIENLSKEELKELYTLWYVPQPILEYATPVDPEVVVDCFDYYTFGSINVNLNSRVAETPAGSNVSFFGEITNENSYPVVNGQLWVKMFRTIDGDEDLLKANGVPLSDFFLIEDNITLAANGSVPFTYDWSVPVYAEAGHYFAAYYFTTEHRYNLAGLTFTDDVTGNTTPFKVVSSNNYQPVEFDKNSVTLNNTEFNFATPPPHFLKTESVTLNTVLKNNTDQVRIIEIEWVSSRWDGLLKDNELNRQRIGYEVPPGGIEVSYAVPPAYDSSVTFIQGILTDRDAKSIIHVRFVRDEIGEIRINYPSILSYPLIGGKENTVFSCVHATNLPIVEDNVLTLTLKDESGNTVHSYTYTGGITGSMMGVKDTFVPEMTLANFSLTATLEHAGEKVDEVTINYNCDDIDPSGCVQSISSSDNDQFVYIVITILTLLTVLLIVFVLYKRKRTSIGLEDIVETEPSDLEVTNTEN